MATLVVPFTFAGAGANTPTTELDANNNTITAWINARNPTVGPIGSRPAAGNAGAVYMASDQGYKLYVDDGAAWQTLDYGTLPSSTYLNFTGIAPPSTPASGSGRLFADNTNTGLRRPSWLDAGGQLYRLGGYFLTLPFKDINTTAAETSIFTSAPTIKGNTLINNRALQVHLMGDVLNNTGASRGFTLRVKYGGTTLLTFDDSIGSLATNASRRGVQMVTHLWAGVPGQNLVQGTCGIGGTLAANDAPFTNTMATNTAGTVDMTVDQTLDITVQPEVSAATLSIRSLIGSVALVGAG